MLKIVIVGATGLIGRAVANLLARDHKVVRVGNLQGDMTVDLRSKASIEELFKTVGPVDGVICTAGSVRYGKINEASDADFLTCISSKIIWQFNLVHVALRHLNPKGFITLTSGMMAQEPLPGAVPTAIADAGVEGFVRAAALDLAESGIRINAVSPIFINITARKMGLTEICTMTKEETAMAYLASAEGNMTGQILDLRGHGSVKSRKLETADWWGLLNIE